MKRAHMIPLVPGGPADISMILRVYGGMRSVGASRLRSWRLAVRQAWIAWRFLRAEQRTGVTP